MTNKISNIFNVKLSKIGKQLINEWINEEFGTLYYATKQLIDDESIKDFINDMLEQNKMTIEELCLNNTKTLTKKDNNDNPFKKITKEMVDLYERKNADYGSSASDTYKKFGMNADLVRMNDKLNRAITLVNSKNQQIKTESLRDTLIDLANYSVLAIIDLEDENETESNNN